MGKESAAIIEREREREWKKEERTEERCERKKRKIGGKENKLQWGLIVNEVPIWPELARGGLERGREREMKGERDEGRENAIIGNALSLTGFMG